MGYGCKSAKKRGRVVQAGSARGALPRDGARVALLAEASLPRAVRDSRTHFGTSAFTYMVTPDWLKSFGRAAARSERSRRYVTPPPQERHVWRVECCLTARRRHGRKSVSTLVKSRFHAKGRVIEGFRQRVFFPRPSLRFPTHILEQFHFLAKIAKNRLHDAFFTILAKNFRPPICL